MVTFPAGDFERPFTMSVSHIQLSMLKHLGNLLTVTHKIKYSMLVDRVCNLLIQAIVYALSLLIESHTSVEEASFQPPLYPYK